MAQAHIIWVNANKNKDTSKIIYSYIFPIAIYILHFGKYLHPHVDACYGSGMQDLRVSVTGDIKLIILYDLWKLKYRRFYPLQKGGGT